MKITDSINIKAPIDRVFRVFTDLSQAEKNVTGINKIEILKGPALMKTGTKWRETRVMFGKEATEEMWVTSLDKNKSYVVEAESHGTKYRSEYTFHEGGGQTKVKFTFVGTPVSFTSKVMSLLAFLFAGATKKALHKDLEDLKQAAEAL